MRSLWSIILVPPATHTPCFHFRKDFGFPSTYTRYQLYLRFVKPCQKMIHLSHSSFLVLGRREKKKQRWQRKKNFSSAKCNTRLTASHHRNTYDPQKKIIQRFAISISHLYDEQYRYIYKIPATEYDNLVK